MADDLGTSRKKTGRGIKIALGVSLAVNLVILGLIGGAIFGGGPDRAPRDRGNEVQTLGLGLMGRVLDREGRADVIERANANRAEMRGSRDALLLATRDFVAAVEAEEFDRAAAEAALAAQRQFVGDLQSFGHTALLDHIEMMTASERAEFASDLTRILRRHPRPD